MLSASRIHTEKSVNTQEGAGAGRVPVISVLGKQRQVDPWVCWPVGLDLVSEPVFKKVAGVGL